MPGTVAGFALALAHYGRLLVEPGISPDTLDLLARRGHHIVTGRATGSTQSIMRVDEGLLGASDPRRPGALTLGY